MTGCSSLVIIRDSGVDSGLVAVPSLAERGGNFSALASQMVGSTVGGAYWAGILSQELGYTVINGEAYYPTTVGSKDEISGTIFYRATTLPEVF